jgi:hypothetical protein
VKKAKTGTAMARRTIRAMVFVRTCSRHFVKIGCDDLGILACCPIREKYRPRRKEARAVVAERGFPTVSRRARREKNRPLGGS